MATIRGFSLARRFGRRAWVSRRGPIALTRKWLSRSSAGDLFDGRPGDADGGVVEEQVDGAPLSLRAKAAMLFGLSRSRASTRTSPSPFSSLADLGGARGRDDVVPALGKLPRELEADARDWRP